MTSDTIRLNLGAGKRALPGYRNIDIKDGRQAYPLTEYQDGTVDEVRAVHLLEHFPASLCMDVLREWVRVLKPGGVLRISVPDLEKVARRYIDGLPDNTQALLMGGQRDEHDYHKSVWDCELLTEAMTAVGLEQIAPWDGDNGDCSTFPISLNLQGIKGDGPQTAFDWLKPYARNVYSQFGEDGVIRALLDRFPEESINRHAVEIGAADGVFMSNTRALVEAGWNAVWYERDVRSAEIAKQLLMEQNIHPRVTLCQGEITAENIADVMSAHPCPDVLSIDVDGPDYHLWNSLPHGYQPKVVVIEFDPARHDDAVPPRGADWQAGVNAIERLALAKGYAIVCTLGCNAVCVRRDMLDHIVDPSFPGPKTGAVIGKSVAAVMSLPRLAFTDNMFCALEALTPLGIRLMRSSGVFWGQCLTDMIEKSIEAGFRYILTLDYDTVFGVAEVRELYRLMEHHPEVDAICAMQMKRSSDHVLFTVTNKAGDAIHELAWEELDQELLRVNTAHFGLTLFRASAFADLPKPWFLARPDQNGRWDGPIIENNKVIGGKMDEDIAFWASWRDAGKTLYQANRVTIGHIQMMVTWPGEDLKPAYQHIYDYNLQGKPAEGIR